MILSRPPANCDPATVSQRLANIFNWTQTEHFDETLLKAEKMVCIQIQR